MMEYGNLNAILAELAGYAHEVKEEDIEQAVEQIVQARHIFLAGAGRSGFIARAFANRLMHLGLSVSFVGEPTTPPIGEGDLLIIGSGSGTTSGLVVMAEKAKKMGAKILTITISPQKTIGQMADAVIVLPGTTRTSVVEQKQTGSIQPVGSMFEQLCWLTYDAMVMTLMERLGQSKEDLLARHANLE